MDMKAVISELRFPERPVAIQDGSVILVEIFCPTLNRALPDGRIEVIAELGGEPNDAATDPEGVAFDCNNGGSDGRTAHRRLYLPNGGSDGHSAY